MRTFAVPLAALARAFGGLASGGLGPAGDRCAAAMRAHPELVAYEGAIDTELMRAEAGLVAKIGAEGVLAIGLAGRARARAQGPRRRRARGRARGVALARAVLGLDGGGARGARGPRRSSTRAGSASASCARGDPSPGGRARARP